MVDGVPSEEVNVISGVPQGSILGPLLYIILGNSAEAVVESSSTGLKLFADDRTMFRIIFGPSDETELQRDLDSLISWADDRKLKFDALKSVHVRFSARRTASSAPVHILGGTTIPRKDTVKYLGLHLDSKLSWKTYVQQIVTKVSKRVRYVYSLFPPSCQRARLVLFASLVLPLFNYCAAVVHPQLKTLNDAMEKTVNTFLKSNNLGESQGLSSEEKYCSRLMQ